MQIENGKIYEGTVKSIANYGVFVDIANPENRKIMGMVHISEISRSYVSEIREFVTEGQAVKVKVIAIGDNGKISLSMKQTEPEPERSERPQRRERRPMGGEGRPQRENQNRGERPERFERGDRPERGERPERQDRDAKPNVWEPKKKAPVGELTFEDMLSRFKQNSEERMCDIKRNTERKNRSRRK